MLLSRKPIRQGDVLAFEESFAGARWGWIIDIGLMYIKVATRDGVLLLIPNEAFVTQKNRKFSPHNPHTALRVHHVYL
jgi:small-conductance mechanosensitive channel